MAAHYEISAVIKDLSDAFPDWKPADMKGTLAQYERALVQYPYDLLKKAAARCIDSCVFFPKIAEIHKAIRELTSNPNTYQPDTFQKQPTSPNMQAYLNDFRRKMIEKGQWHEGRRKANRVGY